jgi:hypothetical protein
MISASGQPLPVLGSVDLSLNINGFVFCHTFFVLSNLNFSGLLGVDFLTTYQGDVSLANRALYLMNGLVVTPLIQSRDNDNVLTLSRPVTIPARSEAFLPVATSENYRSQLSLIEAWPAKCDKTLLVAKALVRPNRHETFCRVANLTSRPKRLRRGTPIAMISPINAQDSENVRLLSTNFENKQTDINVIQEQSDISHEEKLAHLQTLGLSFKDTKLAPDDMIKLCAFLYDNRDLFATDMTQLPPSNLPAMKIELTDYKPIRQRQYRLSPHLQKELENQCDQLQQSGVIRQTVSPWNMPCILIKKPNNQYRFCLDARKINLRTLPEFHNLETLDSCRDKISQSKASIFTVLDQKCGYRSLRLDPLSMLITAFSTDTRRFEFTRVFFGLRNAPSYFVRCLTDLLQPQNEPNLLIYIDDLAIFSDSVENHLKILQRISNKYRSAALRFNANKCAFACESIKYLGMIFSKNGMAIDKSRYEFITNWPRPHNVKTVRSWLGLSSYFRSFVKGYASLTAPLRKLLLQDQPFVWGNEQEQSFNKLKQILTSDIILAYPNPENTFIVETDASAIALGYTLLEQHPVTKVEKVIAYAGRATRSYERNASACKLEILALVQALEHFHPYISNGKKFIVRSDNIALKHIRDLKFGKGQMIRWSLLLDSYNFELQWKKGSKKLCADARSRRDYQPELPEPPPVADIDPNAYVAMIADDYFEDRNDGQRR